MVASDMHVNMVVVTYVENTLVQIAMFGCTLKKVMTVLVQAVCVHHGSEAGHCLYRFFSAFLFASFCFSQT